MTEEQLIAAGLASLAITVGIIMIVSAWTDRFRQNLKEDLTHPSGLRHGVFDSGLRHGVFCPQHHWAIAAREETAPVFDTESSTGQSWVVYHCTSCGATELREVI